MVAMSGGVDSSVTAALAEVRGLRRRRDHAAALRPWRSDPPQGRLLRRPRHPRRPQCRRADRHSALRARLRKPLPRIRDRQFCRQLRARRNAGAVHRVQPLGQVSRSAVDRARARRAGARDRPLCRLAPPCRRIARAGVRRRCRSRPELFPVRDHARATRLPALSARRHDQAARCANWRGASASKSPTSRTARTSASCRPGATPTSSAA